MVVFYGLWQFPSGLEERANGRTGGALEARCVASFANINDFRTNAPNLFWPVPPDVASARSGCPNLGQDCDALYNFSDQARCEFDGDSDRISAGTPPPPPPLPSPSTQGHPHRNQIESDPGVFCMAEIST